MARPPSKAGLRPPTGRPVGPAPENIARFAKRLLESTGLHPVTLAPRPDGVWAVEGFEDKRLQFRAIFTYRGSFIGAWDPQGHCPILRKVERELAEARRRRDEVLDDG